MGVKDILRTIRDTSQSVIPLYAFPESAVRALNGMVHYGRIKQRTYEEPQHFHVDRQAADQIIQSAVPQNRTLLDQNEIQIVMQSYGIPVPQTVIATSAADAAKAASSIGFPLVLKARMKTKLHKTDFGGVAVDLRNPAEVETAYNEMKNRVAQAHLQDEWLGVYLQPMIRGGKEVIIGVTVDPTFGSLLGFGLGGVYVETMKDTIFRAIPINRSDAMQMIHSIKGYPLLEGVRGETPVDIEFLAEVLQRISQLASDFPQIRDMEINPFIITPDRANSLAVDVRMILGEKQ
jgi:acetyltransferase